jgi:hypothetical protein
MAIAAPEQTDLVPISDQRMPSFVLLIATAPSRHTLAIISTVTVMPLFLYLPEKLVNLCLLLLRENSLCHQCPFFYGVQKIV